MPRGKKTVASFAPEMLELFQHGAKKEITIDGFKDLKSVQAFVYRMNRLRVAMREERHWLLPCAEGTQISFNEEKLSVSVKPTDIDFLLQIREALDGVRKEKDEEENDENEEFEAIDAQASNDILKAFLRGETGE